MTRIRSIRSGVLMPAALRQSYIGNHPSPNTEPPEISEDDGGGLAKVEQHRSARNHLLNLPRGRVAVDRGIVGKPPDWEYWAASPGPPDELPF